MSVSHPLFAYNTLAIYYNPTNKCENCFVTMAMEVLHNSCNMCSHDLPDIYTLSCQLLDLDIHSRQIHHAHVHLYYGHEQKLCLLIVK